MTRTGKISKLMHRIADPFVEIHPDDAMMYQISDADPVQLESPRGQIEVKARITDRVPPGVVFLPFHWGDLNTSRGAMNILTNDAFDPISQEPELKVCAVKIRALSKEIAV
jgi:anaerobic selenocysteine-containing dehydrogenase